MKKNPMRFVTVKSGLESVGGAYLGQFVLNGTDYLDDIARRICKERPAIDEPEVRLCVRAIAAEIREELEENFCRVAAGDVAFEPAISGSVPAMDSPLTDENELYVNIVSGDALKARLAAITPTRGSDASVRVRIEGVEDLDSHEPWTVVGTGTFVMSGLNLSATGDGESLKILDADGTEHPCTVDDEDGMGQRIYAHLPASLSEGERMIALVSRGYSTPDAEPEKYTKKITVRYVAPEPIGKSTDGTLVIMSDRANGADWAFTGSGFQAWEAGQRGIPQIEVIMGEACGQFDTFEIAADGTKLVLADPEQVKALTDQLEGPADGTARISFVPGSEASAETITVPIHYEPAE